MIEHAKIFEKELKNIKHYDVIKKHYATYASGFDMAKELRIELMKTKNAKQAEKVVEKFCKKTGK
jgi:tRNA-dihydrouridine synthase